MLLYSLWRRSQLRGFAHANHYSHTSGSRCNDYFVVDACSSAWRRAGSGRHTCKHVKYTARDLGKYAGGLWERCGGKTVVWRHVCSAHTHSWLTGSRHINQLRVPQRLAASTTTCSVLKKKNIKPNCLKRKGNSVWCTPADSVTCECRLKVKCWPLYQCI